MRPTSDDAFIFADTAEASLKYGPELAGRVFGRYDVKDIYAPYYATVSGEIFLEDTLARHIWPDELINADPPRPPKIPEPFQTSLAERMATVALSRTSGRWGTYWNTGNGTCVVTCDGVRAVISGSREGWCAAIVGSASQNPTSDPDLETALARALTRTTSEPTQQKQKGS